MTSIDAWRRISSLPPLMNDSGAPVDHAIVRVLSSTAGDLGVLAEQDPGQAALASPRRGRRATAGVPRRAEPPPGRRRCDASAVRLRLLDGARVRGRLCGSDLGRRRRLGAAGRARSGARRRVRRSRRGASERAPAPRQRPRAPSMGHPLLEPVEPGHHALGRVVGAGQQHPRADQLEQQPGAVAPLSSVSPRRRGRRPGTGRPARSGPPGRRAAPPGPRGRRSGPRGRVGHRRMISRSRSRSQQVLGEPARVLAGLDHLVDDPEDAATVARRERVDDLVEQAVGVKPSSPVARA